MSRKLLPVSISAALMGGAAFSDVPNVAADIAPIHSLVARVMDGIGTPKLIVQQGASPHEYHLRPSEAAALQEADLVFWVGEDLTPWMEGAIETLTDDAVVTALLETDGTVLLDFREDALFEAHDHGDDHDEDGDHADHDHDDDHAGDGHHGHDEDRDHAEHAHGDDHDDHDHDQAHEGYDPHAWLSLENASTWLNVIAAQLSSADPDNAGAYFANAAAARAEMDALSAEVAGILEPVSGGSFIVFHDAYQYFEDTFDFPASGAISLSDATDPSPARITEIHGRIREEGVDCVLTEPQFNPGIVAAVLGGTNANTGVIDPIGADLEPGASLYPHLIRRMAKTLAECLVSSH